MRVHVVKGELLRIRSKKHGIIQTGGLKIIDGGKYPKRGEKERNRQRVEREFGEEKYFEKPDASQKNDETGFYK